MVVRPSRRFRREDFLESRWFSLAWPRISLPFLVTAKRLAAPRWLFILGTYVVSLECSSAALDGGCGLPLGPWHPPSASRPGCPARCVPRAGCPSGCARRGRGGAALGLRRALAWREHRDHVAAVLPSRTVDLGDVHDVGGQSFEQAPTELGVGHLPAAEHDGHLDLVALLEESLDVALLRLVVVVVDLGPHLHFLEDHQALLAPGLLGLDGLLVLVLRVVHHFRDGRAGQRRNLDEVEVGAASDPQSSLSVHHPELLAVGADHPDLSCPDTVVDSRLNADATSLLHRPARAAACRPTPPIRGPECKKAARGPPHLPSGGGRADPRSSKRPGGEKPSLLLLRYMHLIAPTSARSPGYCSSRPGAVSICPEGCGRERIQA